MAAYISNFGPPKCKGGVGHWVLISLYLKGECFQYLDSLYGVKDQKGWDIFEKMVKSIKHMWKRAADHRRKNCGSPLTPVTIDDFKTHYMSAPKQNNP